MYEDCCDSPIELNTCEEENEIPSGLEFTCHSIYPNSNIIPNEGEAFWMVSSCPGSNTSQARMSGNCASLNSSLPPVTDLNTGIVYANEDYAICNGVQTLSVWQPNLACTSYVYEQINEIGVQALFAMDPTIFQTQCQTCSYQMPTISLTKTTLSPRPCITCMHHSASRCLEIKSLRSLTGQEMDSDVYNTLVNTCERGPYDVVKSFSTNILYRNPQCALCIMVKNFITVLPQL